MAGGILHNLDIRIENTYFGSLKCPENGSDYRHKLCQNIDNFWNEARFGNINAHNVGMFHVHLLLLLSNFVKQYSLNIYQNHSLVSGIHYEYTKKYNNHYV